jgi:hypothetical protein
MSVKNHPSNQIIGNKYARVETRIRICSLEQQQLTLLSTFDPSNFEEANKEELWIKAMDGELDPLGNR